MDGDTRREIDDVFEDLAVEMRVAMFRVRRREYARLLQGDENVQSSVVTESMKVDMRVQLSLVLTLFDALIEHVLKKHSLATHDAQVFRDLWEAKVKDVFQVTVADADEAQEPVSPESD